VTCPATGCPASPSSQVDQHCCKRFGRTAAPSPASNRRGMVWTARQHSFLSAKTAPQTAPTTAPTAGQSRRLTDDQLHASVFERERIPARASRACVWQRGDAAEHSNVPTNGHLLAPRTLSCTMKPVLRTQSLLYCCATLSAAHARRRSLLNFFTKEQGVRASHELRSRGCVCSRGLCGYHPRRAHEELTHAVWLCLREKEKTRECQARDCDVTRRNPAATD
jgi:hypothetical protein